MLTVRAFFALLFTGLNLIFLSPGHALQADPDGKLSDEQTSFLVKEITPAIVAMLGDSSIVDPSLVRNIVRTSVLTNEDRWLFLYSPVHLTTVFIYNDPNHKQFVWALGPREMYSVFGYNPPSSAPFFELRYQYLPTILRNAIYKNRQNNNFILNTVYPATQRARELEDNRTSTLEPIVRRLNPTAKACIDTFDRGALINMLRAELPNREAEDWFDDMFLGNVVPNSSGSTTLIFISDLTRRLHLFVPTKYEGARCVPSGLTMTFIK